MPGTCGVLTLARLVLPTCMSHLCRGPVSAGRGVSSGSRSWCPGPGLKVTGVVWVQMSVCTRVRCVVCTHVCTYERGRWPPRGVCPAGLGPGTRTDQHVLLRVEPQLPALVTLLVPLGAGRPVGAARSLVSHGEGPGHQEAEVVRDVRGVGQLQVVRGHQLAQHLRAHRGGAEDASPPASGPRLGAGGGGCWVSEGTHSPPHRAARG